MKTVFVAVNAKYVHTSLSVRCLKRYAEQSGVPSEFSVCEWNINSLRNDVLADLYREKGDIYCFSVYLFNRTYLLPLIRNLRLLLPNGIFICGGPEVSADPKGFFAEFPQVDFLSLGEGERVLTELIFRLTQNSPSEVKKSFEEDGFDGVSYLYNNAVTVRPNLYPVCDLDTLPFPYEEEELDSLANRILYFETSRGCPYFCTYCASGREKGVRSFSEERIQKDFLTLLSHPLRQVKLVDRTFNYNPARALSILRFLAEHHNGVTNFHFEIAPWLIDDPLLSFLETVPRDIFRFEAGIQTTNPQTLRAIRRYVDLPVYRERLQRLIDMGFTVHLDLIAGLPCENYESFGKSFDEVISLRPEELQLGFLKVLAGTETAEDEVSGNVFEPRPPYTLLYNRYLSYEDTERLRRMEKLHDRLYNGDMMKETLFSAASEWYGGSVFALLEVLEEKASSENLFGGEWSSEFLYRFTASFLIAKQNCHAVMEKLIEEYCLYSAPSVLPDWTEGFCSEEKDLFRSLLNSPERLDSFFSPLQKKVFYSREPKKWSRNAKVLTFSDGEKRDGKKVLFLFSSELPKNERTVLLYS